MITSMPPEYSKRLGVITPVQFGAALDRFGLGAFVSAEAIPFGLFGQNVFVTSSQGAWVLRGCPHYDWQFPTEQYFAGLIHEQTDVPVPHPYLLDPETDIFGWSYVLMPRMPGVQLADEALVARLGSEDRRGLARAMARTLAELHTVGAAHAGSYDYRTGRVEPFARDYRETIIKGINDLLADARGHNANTTDADAEWVERLVRENQAAMREPYDIRLVLHDFKEANLVAERRGDGWRVSGVFDLMEAHFGDPEADLQRLCSVYADLQPLIPATMSERVSFPLIP